MNNQTLTEQKIIPLSFDEKKQVLRFMTKRYFYKDPTKKEVVEQWWLYSLHAGSYIPIVGTTELNFTKAKEILSEEH